MSHDRFILRSCKKICVRHSSVFLQLCTYILKQTKFTANTDRIFFSSSYKFYGNRETLIHQLAIDLKIKPLNLFCLIFVFEMFHNKVMSKM